MKSFVSETSMVVVNGLRSANLRRYSLTASPGRPMIMQSPAAMQAVEVRIVSPDPGWGK